MDRNQLHTLLNPVEAEAIVNRMVKAGWAVHSMGTHTVAGYGQGDCFWILFKPAGTWS